MIAYWFAYIIVYRWLNRELSGREEGGGHSINLIVRFESWFGFSF